MEMTRTALEQNIDTAGWACQFLDTPEMESRVRAVIYGDGDSALSAALGELCEGLQLKNGRLPGVMLVASVAMQSVLPAHYFASISRISWLVALPIGVIPFAIGYVLEGAGKALGQSTAQLLAVNIFALALFVFFYGRVIFFIVVGGCEYKKRHAILSRIDSMIREDTEIVSRDGHLVLCACPPLLPLDRPSNVQAWLNARQVLRHFGAQYNSRIQAYTTLMAGAGILLGVAVLVGYISDRSVNVPVTVIVCYDLAAVACCAGYMLWQAWKCNAQTAIAIRTLAWHEHRLLREAEAAKAADSAAAETHRLALAAVAAGRRALKWDDRDQPMTVFGVRAGDGLAKALATVALSGISVAGKALSQYIASS